MKKIKEMAMDYRRNERKKQIVVLLVCWILFTSSALAATWSAATSVLNELETGIVDISLEEYMLDENKKEVLWKDKSNIMPGDYISKIPKITNEAMDCWVRAKVKISSKLQTADALSLEHIKGISKDWIKIGQYFYYTKVLASRECVTLFDGIDIPKTWSKEHEQDEIKIIVQVDAVQQKNFTPNFSSDTPWGGLSVKKCIHEDEYDLNEFKVESESSLSVQYEGDAKKMLASPDNFFAQFGTLMPGDSQRGVVKVKNRGKNPIDIFFKTEGVEESELLEKIKLTIKNKADDSEQERVVYDGNLRSRQLDSYVLLGSYRPSYEGEFIFELKLPEELDNTYSLEKRKVKWYFMASEHTSSSSATTSYTNTTSSYRKSTSQSSDYNVGKESIKTASPYKNGGEDGSVLQKTRPKTKDSSRTCFYIILSLFSLTGICMTMRNLTSFSGKSPASKISKRNLGGGSVSQRTKSKK